MLDEVLPASLAVALLAAEASCWAAHMQQSPAWGRSLAVEQQAPEEVVEPAEASQPQEVSNTKLFRAATQYCGR